jgi:hypothetical protein
MEERSANVVADSGRDGQSNVSGFDGREAMGIEVRSVCTLLQVFDMPASVRFYRDVLGFVRSPANCSRAYRPERNGSNVQNNRIESTFGLTEIFAKPEVAPSAITTHYFSHGPGCATKLY